jgi:nucleotide-binding universal stress UspA family protein
MNAESQLAAVGGETGSTIVVGVDGSPDGRAALRWAAAQAGRTRQHLRLVTALGPNHQFIDDREAQVLMEKVIADSIQEALDIAPGVTISHSEQLRAPRRALVDESGDADLLVVGSRGSGGFAGLALGSVSRGCAHQCRCPVVVVRASEGEPSADLIESASPKIVVGVDGSTSSDAALLWAAREADITGATLEAITTWDWVQDYGWGFVIPHDLDPAADSNRVLEQALEPVRSAFPDVTLEPAVIEGPAAQLLVKASVGADLVAVGSRGHSEFRDVLLGSVSEYCVTHAHCPVLVMHKTDD